MKTYKVCYTLEQYIRHDVSPFTGKPYAKPRRRMNFIELTEYIIAEDLVDALSTALKKAVAQSWRLDVVEEIRPEHAEVELSGELKQT